MAEPIPYKLDNGDIVYIEVEDRPGGGGMQQAGRTGEEAKKAAERLSESLKHVKPAAETVLNAFKGMNTPDEIGMEFGVKFSGKVGVMLASVDSEATFKVSLKWTNSRKAPEASPSPGVETAQSDGQPSGRGRA